MFNPEYYLIPLLMKEITGVLDIFRTGYVLIDVLLLTIFGILFYNNSMDLHAINGSVVRKITSWVSQKKRYAISMSGTESARSGRSFRFRAVMHLLYNDKKNGTLRSLQELTDYEWNEDNSRLDQVSEYLVNQAEVFALDTKKDIYGCIKKYYIERQAHQYKERVNMTILEIYSYTTDVFGLQEWLETISADYKQFLRSQSNKQQLLLTAVQNCLGRSKHKREEDGDRSNSSSISIDAVPWDSTITFENSYFPDMENVVNKINFFLENKQWYKDHGIPYNLGILLYGDPGCGKTRFIKQLLNHTKRHGICVNLGEISEFKDLNNIIFNEELDDKYVIPQEQRILILEDIDAMGDAVKSRKKDDKPKTNTNETNTSTANGAIDMLCMLKDMNEQKQQQLKLNLSVILNALDGVHECTGRIVVMTSNHPELLDEALIRSGRIDIKVEFKRCTRYDIAQLIKRFWKIDLALEDMPPDLNRKYTAAYVINIFNGTRDFETIRHHFI